MPRNPFTVLGLPFDATAEAIKVAWRGLARQHHPDVASGDPLVERRANRTMAEINAAYAELRDPVKRRAHREAAARSARADGTYTGGGEPVGYDPGDAAHAPSDRPEWVARPHVRPVTGRIDTSALLRPRTSEWREPPRASTPTGPTSRHRGATFEADLPSVPNALETRLRFGKFAGLTLGEVGVIEPSYLDWIVHTISDPEVSLASRVVLRYLGYGPFPRPRLDTVVQRG